LTIDQNLIFPQYLQIGESLITNCYLEKAI
jgi:hypothetical protein